MPTPNSTDTCGAKPDGCGSQPSRRPCPPSSCPPYGTCGPSHPGLDVRVREAEAAEAYELLAAREVDLALSLAAQGAVRAVEVETAYLKGNSAGWIALQGRNGEAGGGAEWFEIIPRTRLQPDTLHRFTLPAQAVVTHVRLDAFPDGGLARMRLHGTLTGQGATDLRARYARLGG